MQNVIIVDLNNFALEKPVTILENGVKKEFTATLEALPSTVAMFSAQANISKIYIYGAKVYAAPIADGISTYAKINFNKQDLEIEVITQ